MSQPQQNVIAIKSIDQTGDAFVDSCYHFDLVEYEEDRDWSKIAEAVSFATQGNEAIFSGKTNRLEEVLQSFNDLKNRFPDFDFCYTWLCNLYLQLRSYGEALQAATDGIQKSRSKFRLCEKMGKIHLKLGKLEDAVRWWIRACVIRVSARKPYDIETLLCLSHVAEGLELHAECRALRQSADMIKEGIRLSSDVTSNLSNLSRAKGTPSMKRAISLFLEQFIYTEKEKKSAALRRIAPRGIYCTTCKTRYNEKQLSWYEVYETGTPCVFYSCPKCGCNSAYYPDRDKGV